MIKKHLSYASLILLTSMAFADITPIPTLTTPNTPAVTAPTQTKPPTINCQYHIQASTTLIDPTLITTWAEKAVMQSFDFSYLDIDKQLTALEACYTNQGWQGFNDALKQSGNVAAIKAQKLTVSSQRIGESKLITLKENEWKVILPMQVVYQNDKEKLTQLLTVNLLITRKVSGDLGVMQMIATPTEKKG